MEQPIHRVLDLVDPGAQQVLNMPLEQARRLLLSDDPEAVLQIEGSFALIARDGERVRLARSLDRPLRYFLAKEAQGPLLVVADRIDTIAERLRDEGYGDQFHPSYTRMVPAHHILTLRLVGCPDPNPRLERFFTPARASANGDLDALGQSYVGALHGAVERWLAAQDPGEPIGVLFSGGADSGAVLLSLLKAILDAGQPAARLKAFTLAVDGGGSDLGQAREFLERLDLAYLSEPVEVKGEAVDPLQAVETIEDYKPLDVDCAAVSLALLSELRRRYPDWRLLADGDGGDENFKDYPIEENPELTIRSVVSNSLLYQEGWGVDCIKHSLTYSGGLSRGCVRTFSSLRAHGFNGFSPHMRPQVVAAAEAIPFAELAAGSHERLYALKGELLRRGVEQVLGFSMPIFPKRRFQHGATDPARAAERFSANPDRYREHFAGVYR